MANTSECSHIRGVEIDQWLRARTALAVDKVWFRVLMSGNSQPTLGDPAPLAFVGTCAHTPTHIHRQTQAQALSLSTQSLQRGSNAAL